MSEKYGKINFTVDEFYKFIGKVVSYNNVMTLFPYHTFDVEIKAITYFDQYNRQKRLSIKPIIDHNLITIIFDYFIMDSCIEYFTLYFESEEVALYFNLKYCMDLN